FTHAASRSSTRRLAMRSASSREATVIRTTRASSPSTAFICFPPIVSPRFHACAAASREPTPLRTASVDSTKRLRLLSFCKRRVRAMGFTITVQELKEKLDRGEKFVLIDVREPWEYNICKNPRAQLIPLGRLATEYKKIDQRAERLVYWHTGRPSRR